MERVNAILKHLKYREYVDKIKALETERIFCKHTIEHFLDTARIAYIFALENKVQYSKEVIYAAALLHDIGRWQQYEEGISHEEASVVLGEEILKEVGFEEQERREIVEAIGNHRRKDNGKNSLSDILYRSDKLSRNCAYCLARGQCNWSEEKKNDTIQY